MIQLSITLEQKEKLVALFEVKMERN
jgi:hypothetical protein